MRDDLKVGVFLCECGGNISDVIDLDEVKDSLDVEFIVMQYLTMIWIELLLRHVLQ